MYWRISQLPELDHLDDGQRRQLLRQAGVARVSRLLFYRALIIGCITSVLAAAFISELFSRHLFPLLAPSLWLLIGVVLYQHGLSRIRKDIREVVTELSAGEQPPMCLTCGYSFRGVEVEACPECGAPAGQRRA